MYVTIKVTTEIPKRPDLALEHKGFFRKRTYFYYCGVCMGEFVNVTYDMKGFSVVYTCDKDIKSLRLEYLPGEQFIDYYRRYADDNYYLEVR